MKRWVRIVLFLALLVVPVVVVSFSYLEDVAESTTPGAREGMIAFITNLPKNILDFASATGYAGVLILMLLEAAAFPIPSEIVLPFAGYLVYRGILEFWLVIFISTLAALIGSFIDYFLGWKLGDSLLTARARIPFVNESHLQRVGLWFHQYGPVAVAVFRLVPAARVLISFPAGAYRMSKAKFAAYTIVGCLPWNIFLVYLGWWLGNSWETVVSAFRYIDVVVYLGFICFGAWIAWKLKSARRRKASQQRV
jgi:membrane protein DedA with SNARE-associated domain